MRRTANETTTQTLTRLIKAMDRQHPVTITALKEEKDDNGKKTGRLVTTTRTIEIFNVFVSQNGDILVRAMDRETRKMRSFRLDRIQTYSIHRTRYIIERPAVDSRESRTVGLATVTVLYPVDCPIVQRIGILADALAA
jgi:predicted DNA-binding transcriptional regulator YafY